jgi:16S rRNA processing protein RimM
VIVDLWTDVEQRLSPGSVLSSARGPLRVVSSKPFGAGRRRHIVQFEEVCDRTAAGRLHGLDLWAPPLEVPGTLWVHELVGARVRDGAGAELGRIQAVEANPASDLLVLESGGLIPARFVTHHDRARRTVVVDIPEGLLDT